MHEDFKRTIKKERATAAQTLMLSLLMFGSIAMMTLILDFPFFFMVSAFTFVIAVLAVIRDDWFLNSMAIPAFPVVFVAIINDIYMIVNHVTWDAAGNVSGWCSLPVHVASFYMALYLFAARNNTSFITMSFSSVLHALWIILVEKYVYPGYVMNFFGVVTGAGVTLVACICSGMLVSVLATVKNSRCKKIDVRCDGGWCPL
jgi:hypothetical protein